LVLGLTQQLEIFNKNKVTESAKQFNFLLYFISHNYKRINLTTASYVLKEIINMKIILIICVVLFGLHHFKETYKREQLAAQEAQADEHSYRKNNTLYESPQTPTPPTPAQVTTSNSNYACDGRTHCSQMHSCEEATFFINNCPGTEMDGDHDGVPCEKQFC